MTEELCRAKFEEWCHTEGFASTQLDEEGNYYSIRTYGKWSAWQAAWNTRAEMEKSDG